MKKAIKLNLGAGGAPMRGYVNLDRKTGDEVYPLAYDDGTVAEIRASHVLEHFSHRTIHEVFADWVRALKPGGIMKIAVPDFEAICHDMAQGNNRNAEGYVMGGHIDANDHHGAVFTRAKLSELFYSTGMERVRYWQSDNADCSGGRYSLNMMAYKPAAPKGTLAFDGVTFVLPTPRYGPSEHHRCIYQALNSLHGRMRTIGGCFWNQHLSQAMEEEIRQPNCRYICTLDYDSLFSAEDVYEMYRIMETHPHIDALVPMQSHRGLPTPLFTRRASGAEVDNELLRPLTMDITTGHFGLTFLRADKLRELPRPWMVARLAPDNTWGPGHVDADIDFWYRWADNGNTVHLANHVVIGHIEDMVLWPSQDLSPIHQRVTDYIKYGKPAEARI